VYREEPASRRWPAVAFGCVVLVVLVLALAFGAARGTADAASRAHDLASSGQYGAAVAMYRSVEDRTGPIYVFDQSDVKAAAMNAQRTMLQWAQALGKADKADQAVAMARAVTLPALASNVRETESSLLLGAAETAANRGDFDTALSRLQELTQLGLAGTGPAAGHVPGLQIAYLIADSQTLLSHGNGVGAVTALDSAAAMGAGGSAQAAPLLPAALLAEADQEIGAGSFGEAVAALQRLVASYSLTSQARAARQLLAEGQPVSGTLVDHAGAALAAQVRLSSHFTNEPGGYLTSGPFFYADADASGNFRFASIPVGGPYVFELFRAGNWETFVDPDTGLPANPVTVNPVTPVDLAFITVS